MSRDITPYILKRQFEDAAPRALSIDYAAALNPQQLAAA
jgi:DNA helicase-2/ATP-dependent DNA helicase PcrA